MPLHDWTRADAGTYRGLVRPAYVGFVDPKEDGEDRDTELRLPPRTNP